MPKGIYLRTKPVWNKGLVADDNLTSQVNQLLSTGQPYTIGRIFNRLVDAGIIEATRRGYKGFLYHLARARAAGRIDGRIPESRGRKPYKGGGVRNKFAVGDKVRIIRRNGRTPEWLREELRLDTPRTVITVFNVPRKTGQVPKTRHTVYTLGTNKMGNKNLEAHGFRAGELVSFDKGNLGRPRSKRAYNRNPADIGGKTPSCTVDSLYAGLTGSPSITSLNGQNQGVNHA